jgi:hypothetical protein
MRFSGRFHNIEEGYGYTLIPVPYRPGWYHYSSNYVHPLYFQHDDGSRWELPQEFDTDYGSVPWLLRWMISPKEYALAFFYHDATTSDEVGLCLFRQMPDEIPVKITFRRHEADSMLYDLMRVLGASWLHASQVYYAVRAWAIVTVQWR